MRQRGSRTAVLISLLTASLSALVAADRPGREGSGLVETQTIEIHVGIRGLAYIGQPLTDLIKKLPGAQVNPFSGQDDAVTVNIADAGISCIAVGSPGDLRIASVGFNLDGVFEGIKETKYRTSKGIGKGSTVNDLLEAYGQPVEVLGEQQPRDSLHRTVPLESPAVPKMYQYKNEDGAIKTFFLVQDHLVKRVVVNELAPLDQHVIKGRPKK